MSTDRKLVVEKIRQIITEKLGYEPVEIDASTTLKEDLGIDSFDSLRIIFEVEDEFDIKVPPQEVTHVKTIDDIVNYIQKRLIKGTFV